MPIKSKKETVAKKEATSKKPRKTTEKQPSGGNKKIHKHPKANTNGFAVNPQNINKNGPIKKNIATIIANLKSQGFETVTKNDVEETFKILTGLTEESLEGLVEDMENPMLVRVVANYLIRDWRNSGITPIEKILERAIGSIETTGSVKLEMSSETLNFLEKMNQLKNDK